MAPKFGSPTSSTSGFSYVFAIDDGGPRKGDRAFDGEGEVDDGAGRDPPSSPPSDRRPLLAVDPVSFGLVEASSSTQHQLEELVLSTSRFNSRLARFPESLCALTELWRLHLGGHKRITAIPAQISSLKKLEAINLARCNISSLPKELGELSVLTGLNLADNGNLGNAPQDEAFPAELGKMGSLQVLALSYCGLRAVPAFVGELQSLERLDLSYNDQQIFATLDILIEDCPRLREVWLYKAAYSPESQAHLEAFKAKLLAKIPNARVFY